MDSKDDLLVQQAQLEGRKHYTSDRPCVRCGSLVRYTSRRNCVACERVKSKANYRANQGVLRQERLAWFKDRKQKFMRGEVDPNTLVGLAYIERSKGNPKMETPYHPCKVCGGTVRYTNFQAGCINRKHHNRSE